MRLSDLQNKDIISVSDGEKIGRIIDINIDTNGSMKSLIIEKYKFLISMFTNKSEIEIKWSDIEKIGTDVILVRIKD